MPIIAAIERSNQAQAEWVVNQLIRLIGDLDGKPIALLGLTFKAGTDDIRESSAVALARRLAKGGARLAGAEGYTHLEVYLDSIITNPRKT